MIVITWDNQKTKKFALIFILFFVGTTYLVIDYMSLPNEENLRWDGEFKYITDKHFNDNSRNLEIKLGNGFMSNIEIIICNLCLMFGFLEMIEFILMFYPKGHFKLSKNILSRKYKYNKEDKEK